MTIPLINAAWNREHRACYSDERLTALYDRPSTLLEVLERRDGPWADVSNLDRVWVACRALSSNGRVRFACTCARRALALVAQPDPRLVRAVDAAEAWARGEATDEQLLVARKEAHVVGGGGAAATYAATHAANAATCAVIERAQQVQWLIEYIKGGGE
jgi:hypothetical protein